MKTNFLRIGKSSLSAVLSIVMVLTTVLAGSFNAVNAETVQAEPLDCEVGADISFTDVETTSFDSSINKEITAAETDGSLKADIYSNKKKTEKVLPESSGGNVTVYFANTCQWDNVYLYSWGNSNSSGFTPVTSKTGLLWEFSIDSSCLNNDSFLFSDSNVIENNKWKNEYQTVNMSDNTIKNTFYEYSSSTNLFVPFDYKNNNKSMRGYWVSTEDNVLDLLKTGSNSITVYFKNTKNWSNVYAYTLAVSDNNTEIKYQGLWPGTEMNLVKKDDSGDIYSLTIHSNTNQIIFNQGNNIDQMDLGSIGDINSINGKMYNPEKTGSNKWEDYDTSNPDPKPDDPTPDVEWYLAGRFDANGKSTAKDAIGSSGWSLETELFQFEYVSNGTYKYVTDQTIADFSADFKINNNTYPRYFVFARKVDNKKSMYGNTENTENTQKAYALKQTDAYTSTNDKRFSLGTYSDSNQFYFNDPTNTSNGKVTFWIETTDDTENPYNFYFTIGETLEITHGLYSDLKYNSDNPYHNGTGTPQVSARILASDNTELKSYTSENGEIVISKEELQTEGAVNLEVTVSSTADSDEIAAVYENSTGINSIGTSSKIVKTYTIDKLITDGSLNTTQLNYYTDYKTDVLNIEFKYYNRQINGSNVETIDSEPTTATIKGSALINRNGTIENAIVNALNFENGGVMNSLKNVVDEYYFWPTQEQAVNGIKELKNYHEEDGSGVYKTYGTSDYIYRELAHHMNSYGKPLAGDELNKTENAWVTYTLTDGTTKVYKENESGEEPDYTLIKSITVWGYNAPKTYELEMYVPENEKSELTELDGTTNIFYCGTKNTSIPCKGFFNQRLGGEDENNNAANSATEYLKQYGITSMKAALGDYTAPAEFILDSNDNKKYCFDGWYAWDKNNKTPVKVSADRYYQNRITANIKLAAGYKEYIEGSTPTQTVGLSVTDNGIDTYYDNNSVKRVSLNTQVNVYGAEDSDKNINKVAAIYLQLPVKDSQGKIISWTQSMIDSLGLTNYTTEGTLGYKIDQYVKNLSHEESAAVNLRGTLTFTLDKVNISDYKVISYNYTTTWEDTTDSKKAVLTNKNRLQFSLPMKAEYYEGGSNSAIIAYAAIYYEGKDWILSDNYIPYIYNLADEEKITNLEGEVTGVEETAP